MATATSPEAAQAAFDEWLADNEAKRRELEHFSGNTRSYYHELLDKHRASVAAGGPGLIPDVALDFMQRYERPMKNRSDEWQRRLEMLDAQDRGSRHESVSTSCSVEPAQSTRSRHSSHARSMRRRERPRDWI